MAEPQSLMFRAGTYAVAFFWGCITLVTMIVSMIKHGPRNFFTTKKREIRPACMEAPHLGTHSFIRLKNVRLHYVSNGAEGKPLMLFLHGFPECWFSWRFQIEEFCKDYRTVAVDMRGYGESDKPKGVHNYTVDKLAEDVRELIEGLGYEKCVLVAHDWGGIVAQNFATCHPDMVQKLILCNIPHMKAFREHIQGNIGQMLKSWYVFMFQLPFLAEIYTQSFDYRFINNIFTAKVSGAKKSACDPDEVEAYKYSISRPGGLTGPINYYRALYQYKRTKNHEWSVKVPTLMVWGEQDRALDKPMAKNSAKYIIDFTLHYIPTASHWVQMDAPEEVNHHMKNFLSGKKA